MVNHFASLLSNLDLYRSTVISDNYRLSPAAGFTLTADSGELIILSDLFSYEGQDRLYSPLINRNYLKIALPAALQRFYDLLFPSSSSIHYKQFLLYCYLRILESSDRSEDIRVYDPRITYNLDELTLFFKQHKLTNYTASDAVFNILLMGAANTNDSTEATTNSFIVKQIPETSSVLVYSTTEQKYYKAGKLPSYSAAGMAIAVTSSGTSSNVSTSIPVGDTGAAFSIIGPLADLMNVQANQLFFSVEAPYLFNLEAKLKELNNAQQIVSDMLSFGKDATNISYENMWRQHFNSAYSLSGLLLAYVERVHAVWQTVM